MLSFLNTVSSSHYDKIFTGNFFLDPLVGALAGSFSFGIPITSYIVGGELRDQGVGLLAVTAFILSWTTVGIAMLPLEYKYFGKKFAIIRNVINFFFAIILAGITVFTVSLL